MLDAFFNRAEPSLVRVVRSAVEESIRQKSAHVRTEHFLLALAGEPETIAAQALASMKIDADSAQVEVNQHLRPRELTDAESKLAIVCPISIRNQVLDTTRCHQAKPVLSGMAVQAMLKAETYSYYFGQERIDPAYLLLGILDLQEAGATKVFEELSANLTFLRRQVMRLIAGELSRSDTVLNVRLVVIEGLKQLADKHETSLTMVSDLALKSGGLLEKLPTRSQLLHMVCLAYLGEFLYIQVAFQRYLLEETMALLRQRCGPLEKETAAAVVASGAQNVRAEVRAAIEYLWSHEFRLINQMLDDAEHDLIGSLIEDLWWAQSEEMALDQSFASALEDHRRSQLLSMQKRRIEISNRLAKLKARLDDTLRQCFLKRSVSA